MPENECRSAANYKGVRVNLGYAAFQIAKAFIAAEHHDDPKVRERARTKIDKWTAVVDGVLAGRIDVGSRVPIADVPGWATLEVVTGGFATGEFLAGGTTTRPREGRVGGRRRVFGVSGPTGHQ